MKQNPMVVHYVDWDIVLKCKAGGTSKEECLKSIWTEEYANPIDRYNVNGMIHIMGQVIEAVVPIEQRAYLLDKILRGNVFNTKEALLDELYEYLVFLDVRKNPGWGWYDLYIIEREGKYYTIEQYDKLKENLNMEV